MINVICIITFKIPRIEHVSFSSSFENGTSQGRKLDDSVKNVVNISQNGLIS